jgi:hypothetical protein
MNSVKLYLRRPRRTRSTAVFVAAPAGGDELRGKKGHTNTHNETTEREPTQKQRGITHTERKRERKRERD